MYHTSTNKNIVEYKYNISIHTSEHATIVVSSHFIIFGSTHITEPPPNGSTCRDVFRKRHRLINRSLGPQSVSSCRFFGLMKALLTIGFPQY